MFNIKVLDCTLRDGGYVNNWDFGLTLSQKFLKNIDNACIEYAEIGFLKDSEYNQEKTVFNEIEQIKNVIPRNFKHNFKIVAMIVYGKFNVNKIVPKTQDVVLDAIRVTFKKNEIESVFDYLEKIKLAGYQLFVNPTNVESYSDEELLNLIKKVNMLNPYGFSIVDTNGVLKENDLLRLYHLINHNLKKDIALCFHSHNNLQLSFSNAQCLIKSCHNRELVIDSTVFGMGRGAGNLCTELLTQYLNDNYNANYNIIPILKIIDEQINPIFAKTPWGYSVPYYLAATNHCHPNYAKYLVDKQTVPVEVINALLSAIPQQKKSTYNQELIKQIYLDKFSRIIDDSDTINKLKNILCDKTILLLAPGKSLAKETDRVKQFINEFNPYIISLNFVPENFNENMVFVTNLKRFSSLENFKSELVVTSNIDVQNITSNIINYSSYINDSKEFDNTALMLFKLLIKIGVTEINIAGLDGFSSNASDNYVSENLLNTTNFKELNQRNFNLFNQITNYKKQLKMNFITESLFVERNFTSHNEYFIEN